MVQSPEMSPTLATVATPLGHRKRRHSEMAGKAPVIDLVKDDESEVIDKGVSNGKNTLSAKNPESKHLLPEVQEATIPEDALEEEEEPIEDDDANGGNDETFEEDEALLEDILDAAEIYPYNPAEHGEEGLNPDVCKALLQQLRKVGPEQFIHDTLENNRYPPAMLGTAFGLPPLLAQQFDEDGYVTILGHAIVRAYQKRQKLSEYNTIDDAADLLRHSQKILVITGAGISTSLGIPDFRSKHTGFYDKVRAEGFNEPEQVFDIHEFDNDPRIFYRLAHGILPDVERHTPTHAFIRLLQDKGKLQTNYTQNIDNIEEFAGIHKDRLIQCHGSFATATCRKCGYNVKGTEIFDDIRNQQVAKCKRCIADIAAEEVVRKTKSKPKPQRFAFDDDDDSEDDNIPQPGVMKPDITFFGEKLPDTFFDRFADHDAKNVDLVLVAGTSLKVAPVSDMPNYIPHSVPHIYISREPIKHINFDIQLLGDCDDVVFELCRRAGWKLKHEMIKDEQKMHVVQVEDSGHMWKIIKEDPLSTPVHGDA